MTIESVPTIPRSDRMSRPHTPAAALRAEYLDRLRTITADLPPSARAELLDNIGAHLAETADGDADEARMRAALDELGTPEEIAAAARDEHGIAPRSGSDAARLYDVGTVLVLLLGGFAVPVAGWIAGVVMIWNGPRWNRREKWLGTLVWPGAIVAGFAVLAVFSEVAGAPVGSGVLLAGLPLLLAAFVAAFVYLVRASSRRRTDSVSGS